MLYFSEHNHSIMGKRLAETDPNDPLGLRKKLSSVSNVAPAPSQDDPLGLREKLKKKEVDGAALSPTGLDISPAANYRQSIKDYNTKSEEVNKIQNDLLGLKTLIDKHDVLQQDPTKIEEFKNLHKQYNDLVNVNNKRTKDLQRMEVLLKQTKSSYDEDNFARQQKLFNSLGLSKKETQELRNQIFKQVYPDRAQEVDAGTFVPSYLEDIDAEDLAKNLTGKSLNQLELQKKISENRSISDRVFGSFGKSLEKTLAFELPSSISATVSNMLADVKIKPSEENASWLTAGSKTMVKKAIAMIPGAKAAFNQNVDDARVATFEWAKEWRELRGVSTPFGFFENDPDLIKSLSQIQHPFDVIDFISANAAQGVAQIPLAVATRGASSMVQEIGNDYLEGVIQIAQEKTQKEKRLVTPAEVIRTDQDEPAIARGFGIAQGALDMLSAGKVMKAIGYDAFRKDVKRRATRWFEELGKSGGSEFITEGAQGTLQQISTGKMVGLGTIESVKRINWFNVLDESMAGLVGGTAVSGGGMAVSEGANRIGIFKDLLTKKNKSQEEQAVLTDLMDIVVETAKKYGDPRSATEIKRFIINDVMSKVDVPKATAPAPEPEVNLPEPEPEVVETPQPTVETKLPQPDPQNVTPPTPEPVVAVKPKKAPKPKVKAKVEDYAQRNRVENSQISAKDRVIAENISRFPKESFERFRDPNFVKDTPLMRMQWLKKSGIPLDVQAQDISKIFNPNGDGTDITTDDLVEFVKRFPGAHRDFRKLDREEVESMTDTAFEQKGESLVSKPNLRYALESIERFGMTPENLASPEIQEYLNNEFLFDETDKENINTIFEYARTEEGLQEINELLASINEQVSSDLGAEREVPGLQAEALAEQEKINAQGFPESWDTNAVQNAEDPSLQANPPTSNENTLNIDTQEQQVTVNPETSGTGVSSPVPAEKVLKGNTKPGKVKKSEKVQKEIDDLFNELNDLMKNTLSANINPQAAVVGAKIVAKYVELGVVKFAEIAADVYANYGEEAFNKYFQALKAGYGSLLATSEDPNLTPLDQLRKAKPEDFTKSQDDDTSTSGSLELDSTRVQPTDQVGTKNVPVNGTSSGKGTGAGVNGTDQSGDRTESSERVSNDLPVISGERSDTNLDKSKQPIRDSGNFTGSLFDTGSGRNDGTGLPSGSKTVEPVEGASGNQIAKNLSFEEKVKLQERANRNVAIITKDKANIAESMPLLLPHQVENVYKAEMRFLNPPPADGGVNKGILFTDGTGTGKSQPLYSKILTPSGWKLMGNIKVGDYVIGAHGHPVKVIGVYPQGLKKIFKVTLSDGSQTKTCDEHLWLTQTLYERRKFKHHPNASFCQPKVRELSEIASTINEHHFIPIVKPIHFKEKKLLIPAYTLGVILGDGCVTGKAIVISSDDDEIIQYIKSDIGSQYLVFKVKTGDRTPAYRISDMDQKYGPKGQRAPHGYKSALQAYKLDGCLSYEKFIPQDYLFGSIETRLSILQGLLDTDGTVDKRTGCASYCSSSKQLAKDVIFLIQSLGGIATLRKKKTYRRTAFIVHINLPIDFTPFRLTRKKILYRPAKKYFPRRKIVSIEFDGLQESQCIAVESSDHLYVTDDCILTHNTFTGLGIMKRYDRMGKKNQLVVVPTDAKVKDWIDEGKFFGINLIQLKDTKDGGRDGSMVITTYANFRQNPALMARANKTPFDLVLYDESHKIVSNQQGQYTAADDYHKQLTNSPSQAWRKAKAKYETMWNRAHGENGTYEERKRVDELINAEAQKLVEATKVVFLSASPFSYHKNLEYADGYLFKIREGEKSGSDSYNNFFVSNFGYRIRYNKLTEPEKAVDIGLMERAFHTRLTKGGAVSSTRLQLDKDYSREFVLIDDKAGMMIDEGIKIMSDHNTYKYLPELVRRKFTWLYRNQLLECIKAKKSVDRIKKHLSLGRKVVVFHGYNNSLPSHPFDFGDPIYYPPEVPIRLIQAELDLFNNKYPEYKALDMRDLKNPIKTMQEAFGEENVLLFNGNVPPKERSEAKRLFNKDNSGKDLIVVQMEAGKEGLSLHDTTGKRQRVMINMGLPMKPTDAIQTEGRIYRIGQQSDAILEYPVLHLNFEKWTFAEKINQRVSTAENLAFGEKSRNLKEAFKEGYKAPIQEDPHENQGRGTRDADMMFDTIDDWEMSKTLYFGRQKRNSKTKAREGTDYYATPEPVGLKIVEWLYPKENQKLLEPSAGHGAIGRFFPENTVNKYIEPSANLRADLSINVNGEVLPMSFEDLHVGANKFDGIAMNPPFGSSGKTAMDHVLKALEHLNNGGRVIAIVPEGPSMDKRIQAWRESEDSNNFFVTAKISMPTVTFERAGTSVKTQILIIDKQTQPEVRKLMPMQRNLDFSYIEDINELFDTIKDLSMPEKVKPVTLATATDNVLKILQTGQLPSSSDVAQVIAGKHTKEGYNIWTVKLTKSIESADFAKANSRAKALGGYYSNYRGNGAITGFIFKGDLGAENADKLASYINSGFNNGPFDPNDPQGRRDTYNPMGSASKSKTFMSSFGSRTVTNSSGDFKLYQKVIDLAHKYNPKATIGQGHQGKGNNGYFFNRSKNVRVNGMNNLSVAMHELTHALDARNGIIQTLLSNTKAGDKVRKRITDVYLKYYPKAKPHHDLRVRMVEGYATLIENFIKDPQAINRDFPDVVQDFLTPGGKYWTDEVGLFITDVTEIVAQYQALDPLAKMGARVTNDVIDQPNKQFLTTADLITTETFDKLHPIEKLAKVNGTHFTQEDVSLWMRLSNNAMQIADKNISSKRERFWQMDSKGEWSEKHGFNYYTLTKSLDQRGLQEEFAAYLFARRIKFEYDELNDKEAELNQVMDPAYLQNIINTMGVSQAAAQAIQQSHAKDIQEEMEHLAGILENEGVSEEEANAAYQAGQPLFQNDEDMYDKLVAEDLEFAHNPLVQLLDDEGYQKFTNRKGYATFKRAFYDELTGNEGVPTIKTSGKTKVSQFLTRRGSEKPVLNPLMGAMINHSEILKKGLKQLVYNKFLQVAQKHPDMFQILPLEVNNESTNRYPQEKNPDILMARSGYKRVPILMDRQIKQVIDENYDYHNAHLLERTFITASQMFRTGTTGIFWQFFINNTFLDQIAASINTRNGMWPFISSMRHVGPAALNMLSQKLFRKATLFPNSVEAAYLKEYLFLAGTSQTFLSADIQGVKHINDIIRKEDKTFIKRANNLFENITKWLSTPGNATEIMTRGTEYILARKAGKSQVVALEEAGRVSAPFHHIGRLNPFSEKTSHLGQSYIRTVPYFNASLQVLKQTQNTLHTKEGKVRYAFAALSMVAAAVGSTLYLLNQDDDDERKQLLKSIPPDSMTKYLYLPHPYSNKKLLQLRIPEQLGFLAGIVNMMLLDSADQTSYKWSEYGEAAMSFAPTQLNPFNHTQMLFSYIPQGIKPTIESVTGVKVYPSVRPIETSRDKSLPAEMRYNKYTTPGAKMLGEALGWSPKKIDNFMQGQFGRAYKYLFDPKKAVNTGDLFEKELYLEASRQVQFFYETKQRISQMVKAHNDGRKEYSSELVQQMWQADALIADIDGLLEQYNDAEQNPMMEIQAIHTRNMIFKKVKDLEDLMY
jgi:hypothetical protein